MILRAACVLALALVLAAASGVRRRTVPAAPLRWTIAPVPLEPATFRPAGPGAPVVFDAAGAALLSGGNSIRRFSLASGAPLPWSPPPPRRRARVVMGVGGQLQLTRAAPEGAAVVEFETPLHRYRDGPGSARVQVPAGTRGYEVGGHFDPALAVTVDGRWLAVAWRQELTILSLDGGAEHRGYTSPDRFVTGPSFSPDGRLLAFTSGSRVGLVDLAKPGGVTAWGEVPEVPFAAPVFLPGTQDVLLSVEGTEDAGSCPWVRAWSPDAPGEPAVAVRGACGRGFISAIAASPDGERIFVARRGDEEEEVPATLTEFSRAGGARVLEDPPDDLEQLRVSPDGRYLVGSGDRGIHAWSLASGRLTHPPLAHVGPVRWIYFLRLPEPTLLSWTRERAAVWRLGGPGREGEARELGPEEVEELGRRMPAVGDLLEHPTAAITIVDGAVQVRDPGGGAGALDPRAAGVRSPVTTAAVSPDASLLVTGHRDGALHLWPRETPVSPAR